MLAREVHIHSTDDVGWRWHHPSRLSEPPRGNFSGANDLFLHFKIWKGYYPSGIIQLCYPWLGLVRHGYGQQADESGQETTFLCHTTFSKPIWQWKILLVLLHYICKKWLSMSMFFAPALAAWALYRLHESLNSYSYIYPQKNKEMDVTMHFILSLQFFFGVFCMCFHAGDCRGSKLHTSLTSVGLGIRCGLMVLATKAAWVFPGRWRVWVFSPAVLKRAEIFYKDDNDRDDYDDDYDYDDVDVW